LLRRSVILFALGNGTALALGVPATIMLARWLGPSDRGLLAIMLSVSSLTYILIAAGQPQSAEYHVSRQAAAAGAIVGNILLSTAALAVVFIPAFWLLRAPIANLFTDGRGGEAWILVGVLIPLSFLAWTTANVVSGLLRFGLFTALLSVSRLVYLGAVLLLLVVLGLGVTAGLLATAVSLVVVAGGSLAGVLRTARLRLDRPLFGSMVGYGVRNQLGLLFQSLNYRLDVVILQFFRPLEQVGYYVVAQIVAELTIALANSFAGVVPIVAREEREEERAVTTTASIRHYAILAAASLVVTAAAGPVMIKLAFGPSFDRAIVPMLLLLPGIWFLGTGTVAAANLGARGRPGVPSALAAIACAVTVGLDLALIPPLGVYGAVIASVAAYTTYGIGTLLALSRVTGLTPRVLVVPTRADFRLYPAAAARLLATVRRA
jgi:O-antigen/teichoic acid export membrane protein